MKSAKASSKWQATKTMSIKNTSIPSDIAHVFIDSGSIDSTATKLELKLSPVV